MKQSPSPFFSREKEVMEFLEEYSGTEVKGNISDNTDLITNLIRKIRSKYHPDKVIQNEISEETANAVTLRVNSVKEIIDGYQTFGTIGNSRNNDSSSSEKNNSSSSEKNNSSSSEKNKAIKKITEEIDTLENNKQKKVARRFPYVQIVLDGTYSCLEEAEKEVRALKEIIKEINTLENDKQKKVAYNFSYVRYVYNNGSYYYLEQAKEQVRAFREIIEEINTLENDKQKKVAYNFSYVESVCNGGYYDLEEAKEQVENYKFIN